MTSSSVSDAIGQVLGDIGPFVDFFLNSKWAKKRGQPGISDFVVGNPHEAPVPGYASTLQKWTEPQSNDWFAYQMSEPYATEVVAPALRAKLGIPFEPEHITMTTGAMAGLAVTIRCVVNPGDEVIFVTPPWFFYDAIITASGAVPVRVPVKPNDFDLDLDAIRQAISPRTRAIIVNSPNNPTGRIYPPETLRGLADLLSKASAENGRTIYLISDEAYSHILAPGAEFHSPLEFYPASFLIYTYGKTLLTPGQRLGYIAVSPDMQDVEQISFALVATMVTSSYGFPNAVLQRGLADLEKLSIDIDHLNAKRDRMMNGLRVMGYDVTEPEGTFYLLVKSPIEDDLAFADRLAEDDVFILPGSMFEMPGYFRISLTATMEMIERALPVFAAAIAPSREVVVIARAY
jgi:aspartate aminotransferase